MGRMGAIQQDKLPEKDLFQNVPWATRTMTDVNEQRGTSRDVRGWRGLVSQDDFDYMSFRLYSEQTQSYWGVLSRREM